MEMQRHSRRKRRFVCAIFDAVIPPNNRRRLSCDWAVMSTESRIEEEVQRSWRGVWAKAQERLKEVN